MHESRAAIAQLVFLLVDRLNRRRQRHRARTLGTMDQADRVADLVNDLGHEPSSYKFWTRRQTVERRVEPCRRNDRGRTLQLSLAEHKAEHWDAEVDGRDAQQPVAGIVRSGQERSKQHLGTVLLPPAVPRFHGDGPVRPSMDLKVERTPDRLRDGLYQVRCDRTETDHDQSVHPSVGSASTGSGRGWTSTSGSDTVTVVPFPMAL